MSSNRTMGGRTDALLASPTVPQRRPAAVILRPVAVKATAAIHPKIMLESLSEATGLAVDSIHLQYAQQQATEWHRKWTQQDELGHGFEDSRGYDGGAKNPALSTGSNADDAGSNADDGQEGWPVMPTVAAPAVMLLRPIPRRPTAVDNKEPLPPRYVGCHVVLEERDEHPSPLTLPSATPPLSPMEQHCYHHGGFLDEDDEYYSYYHNNNNNARDALLHALACSGGDVSTKQVEQALLPLIQVYDEQTHHHHDADSTAAAVEGMWLSLSKPTFFGNLGDTSAGDPMYTLGRMAFDMFLPTQLVCSLQGNFNPVRRVGDEERDQVLTRCPKSLVDELERGGSVLRTYNVVTAFTIEPHQQEFPTAPNVSVRRPILGIMTTYGYILPDPNVPNRLSIWFTGGKIEPNDAMEDQREWKRFFGNHANLTPRSIGEKLRCLAANLLMGANPPTSMNAADGSMEFDFERPLGGHGVAYVDVLYLDDTLRVVRGHRGTLFCFARIPETNAETSDPMMV